MNEKYWFRKHLLDEHNEGDSRRIKLEHMIDERFAELYFLIKDEYDVKGNSKEEQALFDMLDDLHAQVKEYCEKNL